MQYLLHLMFLDLMTRQQLRRPAVLIIFVNAKLNTLVQDHMGDRCLIWWLNVVNRIIRNEGFWPRGTADGTACVSR